MILEENVQDAIEPLIEMLKDEVPVRNSAIKALSKIGEPAVEPLIKALKSSDYTIRNYAASALGKIRDPKAVKPIISLFYDEHEPIRWTLPFELAEIGEPAIEPLIEFINSSDTDVIHHDFTALGVIGEPAIKSLEGLLDNDNEEICRLAGETIEDIKDPHDLKTMIPNLKNGNVEERRLAAEVAHYYNDPRLTKALIEALKDDDGEVRMYAAESLGKIAERGV